MPRYPGRAREDFATHEIRDGSWLILGTPVRAPPRTRVAYSPVVPFTVGGNTPERATSQSRSRWTHTWQPGSRGRIAAGRRPQYQRASARAGP
jgi:hypothetical protein